MPHTELMPERFQELEEYRARCSNGVAHTPEYRHRMTQLQADYNAWERSQGLAITPKLRTRRFRSLRFW